MKVPFLSLAWLGLVSWAALATERRPNIVFIMTDDHAAHAIGAYGSRINETPNLDRLAREGMRFDNCFAVDSNLHPESRNGPDRQIQPQERHAGLKSPRRHPGHAAKYLQSAGYHTGMIGKWHLGSDPTGFHHWEILPGQGRRSRCPTLR